MTYTQVADNVANVVNILTGNWTAANTDSRTPKIIDVVNSTASQSRDQRLCDWIFVWEVDEVNSANDIGCNTYGSVTRVRVDIRTINGRTHLNKMVGEVERIIHANRNNPVDSSSAAMPFRTMRIDRKTDLSDKRIGTWRTIYDVVLGQPVKIIS